MISNYNVITIQKCNHKVITKFKSIYNVITLFKSNYKIITLLKYNYIIITLFAGQAFALTFDTELKDGTLIYGHTEPDEEIFIQEKYLNIGKNSQNLIKIPTTADGKFVLGIPQDATEISLIIKTPNYSKQKIFSISPRSWDEEYVTGLPPSKVSPNSKDNDRIAAEALSMRQARGQSVYPNFPDFWQNPVPEFTRISSRFGSRRILNNIKKQGHSGVDLAAPIGTSVYTPADGRVVYIHPDMFLTGKTILIDHGFGVFSSYSHLNQINVTLNQEVKAGDPLGQVGQTGRATGPHLHWTVTWYGVRINPEDLILKNK